MSCEIYTIIKGRGAKEKKSLHCNASIFKYQGVFYKDKQFSELLAGLNHESAIRRLARQSIAVGRVDPDGALVIVLEELKVRVVSGGGCAR